MDALTCFFRARCRGQTMVVMIVVLFIVCVTAVALVVYSQSLHQIVIRAIHHTNALNVAEGGLMWALNEMSQSWFVQALLVTNPAILAGDIPPASLGAPPDFFRSSLGETYTPVVSQTQEGAAPRYIIDSMLGGWMRGSPYQVRMRTPWPSPLGEYAEIYIREPLLDYDRPAFRIDLGSDSTGTRLIGLSVMNNIMIGYPNEPENDSSLTMRFVAAPDALFGEGAGDARKTGAIANPDGSQFIRLNSFDIPSMTVNNLHAGYIQMGVNAPDGGPGVYDIAEAMKASGCEAADVVRISAQGTMELVLCTDAYDTRVAGIISEAPWFVMGGGEGKMPLALNGIVPCKVVAENGFIQRGDLLVSSSCPGHAMRAEPEQIRPGMLIGKAMQPLAEESGIIYVLVNKR